MVVLNAGVFAGTAGAEPTITYIFYNCAGLSGTPPTFEAAKTALPASSPGAVSAAAAFRLVDASATYVVLSFGEGAFSPPGISHSGNATVTCAIDFSSATFNVQRTPGATTPTPTWPPAPCRRQRA